MIPRLLQQQGFEMRVPRVSAMNSGSSQVQLRLCKNSLKDFQVRDCVYTSGIPQLFPSILSGLDNV